MQIDIVLLDALANARDDRARIACERNDKVEDSDSGHRVHYEEMGKAAGIQQAANELRSFLRILGG